MPQKSVDRPIFKAAVLSISLMTMIAPAISAALPLMYGAFKGQSNAAVETLLTVPNIGIMVFLFISPFVVRWIGEKQTVVLGLLVSLLSGIVPLFSDNYTLVLVSRFLFGAGVGLFNSMTVSLITDFYHGDQLSTMIGFQSATGAVGSAGVTFLVGYLVTVGWHATFLIYLIALPIVVLFASVVHIKKKPVRRESGQSGSETPKQQINLKIVRLALLIFFVFVFAITSSIKLPELVTIKKIATLSQVSVLLGASTLVGIPVGILYGQIAKRLKDRIFPSSFFIASIGFALIAMANNMVILALGIVLSGVGFGLSVPSIYVKMAQDSPANSTNLSTTILLISTNIGVFLAPTILNFLSALIGPFTSQNSMIVAAIAFALLFVLSLVDLASQKVNKHKVAKS